MWNGFVVGPQTIVRDVQELPAGSTMTLAADGRVLETRRYWEVPVEAERTSLEEFEAVLAESARQHLISDVPLAVFLSGGIDSSSLACLATRAGGEKLRTFNVSFDEVDYDESRIAQSVAEAVGADHTDIRLTAQRFREQLQPALASLDQPTFDGINTYFVSRAVREAGVTVALSGAGGDELFGGYRSFREVPLIRRLSAATAPFPGGLARAAADLLSRALVRRRGEVPPQTRFGKLVDAVSARGSLVDSYQVAYGLFSREFLSELSSAAAANDVVFGIPRSRRDELQARVARRRDLPAVSALELTFFVGERLLRDTDTTSMAVSLETRVPLLDHRVVEVAAGLEDSVRYAPLGRKQALRRTALRDLDPNLFERPKSGFVLPLQRWMRESMAEQIDVAFADAASLRSVGLRPEAVARLWRAYKSRAPGLYWSRVWGLFVLLKWAQQERAAL
jgi:asparagine synthase (glutamine-hydrolysing)